MNNLEMAKNGFLIRYSGTTRSTYETSLRLFLEWCEDNGIDPMRIKRPMIEMYSRHMTPIILSLLSWLNL